MLKIKPHLNDVIRKNIYVDKSQYNWRLDQSERVSGYSSDFFNDFIKTLSDTDFICYPYLKEFKYTLAEHHDIKTIDNLFVTPGSDQCIKAMFDLCVTPGSEVLSTTPCFPMYDVYSQLYQANLKTVEYDKDLNWSIKDMIEKVNDKTSLIIIANPNNPIGDYKEEKELRELFVYTHEMGIPILIDEAYVQFVPKRFDRCLFSGYKYQNVVTCRTFSKALGGAGVRIGYMVSNKNFIEKLEKWRIMHEITGPAVKFGIYILKNYSEVEKYIDLTKEEKSILIDMLSDKYDIIDGYCNWIHLNNNKDNEDTCSILDNHSDLIYKAGTVIPHDNRKNWLRLTIGPEISNTKFIQELSQ